MGLDNGFVMCNLNKKDVPNFATFWLRDYDEPDKAEVIYWRKCWGLRDVVLDVLHASNNDYRIPVEAEDIPAIIRVIKPFFNERYWEDVGDSIWTYDEMFDNLVNSVLTLEWMKWYLEEHPDVTCYFYDSY